MNEEKPIFDFTLDLSAIFKILAFLPIAYEMARIYHGFFGETFRSVQFEAFFYAPYILLGVLRCFGQNWKPYAWILALSVLHAITVGQYGNWTVAIGVADAIASILVLLSIALGGIGDMFFSDLEIDEHEGIKNDER